MRHAQCTVERVLVCVYFKKHAKRNKTQKYAQLSNARTRDATSALVVVCLSVWLAGWLSGCVSVVSVVVCVCGMLGGFCVVYVVCV